MPTGVEDRDLSLDKDTEQNEFEPDEYDETEGNDDNANPDFCY